MLHGRPESQQSIRRMSATPTLYRRGRLTAGSTIEEVLISELGMVDDIGDVAALSPIGGSNMVSSDSPVV